MNLTCEDNYFGRKLDKDDTFFSISVPVKVIITKSKMNEIELDMVLFASESFDIHIAENFVGAVGVLGNSSDSVEFKIESGDSELETALVMEHFAIEKANQLVVKKPFDFELGRNKLRFDVLARHKLDGYEQQASVQVNIGDLNDETPLFIQRDYTFYARERQLPVANYTVGQVYVIDPDLSDSLNFTVIENAVSTADETLSSNLVNVFQIINNTLTKKV